VASAKGDEKWFKAYNNPKMASVKNFFKGAGKKLWKWGKAGVIGELYYIPFGAAYESGRGRNLLEAFDNSIGLGGHFGMEEKNLMKYADKAGYSEENKNFFKQFSQLEKNDNWTEFWQLAAGGDKWAMEKIGKFYPGVPLWDLQEHAAGKIKDLETESTDIMKGLYEGLGVEGIAGKYGEREHLKDVQTRDWINKAKEKEANVIINRAIMKKAEKASGKDLKWPLAPPAASCQNSVQLSFFSNCENCLKKFLFSSLYPALSAYFIRFFSSIPKCPPSPIELSNASNKFLPLPDSYAAPKGI
jgi:hypothetical protein